jgi:hypothetical protein
MLLLEEFPRVSMRQSADEVLHSAYMFVNAVH